MCSLQHNGLRVVSVSLVSTVFCPTSADPSQQKGEGVYKQRIQGISECDPLCEESALCRRLMHTISPNLLFYYLQTKFPPAGDPCIGLTRHLFGSRTPRHLRFWAARAALTARLQYFWVSIWDFEISVKLILIRKLLASGTSSGARFAKDSISTINSSDFL